MIHLKQAVVVEGRYDKAHLASLLDTVIIETGGFRIFKDREKLAMLREIARRRGLVILTDSDAAGFRIRRYLGGSIPKENLYHAYIPDIYGKERRKERPSAEGKLGVEGVSAQVILEALERAGVLTDTTPEPARRITKTDFIDWGLSGVTNSTARRDRIKRALHLPEYLTTNSLIDVLNSVYGYESFCAMLPELLGEDAPEFAR